MNTYIKQGLMALTIFGCASVNAMQRPTRNPQPDPTDPAIQMAIQASLQMQQPTRQHSDQMSEFERAQYEQAIQASLQTHQPTQQRSNQISGNDDHQLALALQISLNEQTQDSKKGKEKEEPEVQKQCNVCLTDINTREFPVLSCNHSSVCKGCLHQQVAINLREKNTQAINCPESGCRKPFSMQDIKQIAAGDRRMVSEFNTLMTKQSLLTQGGRKQCPTPDCQFLFINDDNRAQNFTCPACHKTYCANCLLKHPQRITCKVAKRRELNKNEKWKEKHTKQCPKCKVNIEKNEGCDHMTCQNCTHEFCWLCLADYQHCKEGCQYHIPAQTTPQLGYHNLAAYPGFIRGTDPNVDNNNLEYMDINGVLVVQYRR